MAKQQKPDTPYQSNFLMESHRLERLDKAIKVSYGVILSVGELQKLDQSIIKSISKNL